MAGALPGYLKKLGHEVNVVMPLYKLIDRKKYIITGVTDKMMVQMGDAQITCSVGKTINNAGVSVYFIAYEPYFGRPDIYHDDKFNDFQDNPLRFSFLSKAALQLCHFLNYKPHIIHANDWHTAILPAYLKRIYKDDPLLSHAASVLTIHNIAYQGRYGHEYFSFTGLGDEDFTPDKFECYNAVNLLKGGIQFADVVNTVSPGYASETRTSEGGYGLHDFLNGKGNNYTGILNGVDYSLWDPEYDKLIPSNYSADDLKGKSVCKKVLQKQFGLDRSGESPVIGIVSRLVEQKGFFILSECIADMVNNMDVQFAVLGAGDKRIEEYFGNLPEQYPGRIGSYIGYSNELAHLIEAGSDLFLMPSIYEPCGLNQIYSLKYGTLPIVRATGGLNDTVENYCQDTANGTGFKFHEASGAAIYNTVKWALETYRERRSHFNKLIRHAMGKFFSWEESAGQYVQLYYRALETRNQEDDML